MDDFLLLLVVFGLFAIPIYALIGVVKTISVEMRMLHLSPESREQQVQQAGAISQSPKTD